MGCDEAIDVSVRVEMFVFVDAKRKRRRRRRRSRRREEAMLSAEESWCWAALSELGGGEGKTVHKGKAR